MRLHALTSVRPRRPLTQAVAALLLAPLVAAPAATAGTGQNPHEGVSSIAQYVEDIPTAEGPVAAGGGLAPTPPAPPLQPGVAESIDRAGGADAPTLRELATEPTLGAPTGRLASVREEAVAEPSAATAAATATRGGGLAVLVLLVVLTAITLVSAVVAIRRGRT